MAGAGDLLSPFFCNDEWGVSKGEGGLGGRGSADGARTGPHKTREEKGAKKQKKRGLQQQAQARAHASERGEGGGEEKGGWGRQEGPVHTQLQGSTKRRKTGERGGRRRQAGGGHVAATAPRARSRGRPTDNEKRWGDGDTPKKGGGRKGCCKPNKGGRACAAPRRAADAIFQALYYVAVWSWRRGEGAGIPHAVVCRPLSLISLSSLLRHSSLAVRRVDCATGGGGGSTNLVRCGVWVWGGQGG